MLLLVMGSGVASAGHWCIIVLQTMVATRLATEGGAMQRRKHGHERHVAWHKEWLDQLRCIWSPGCFCAVASVVNAWDCATACDSVVTMPQSMMM